MWKITIQIQAVKNRLIHITLCVVLLCAGSSLYAQKSSTPVAQNNPYKDDKLVHFGFFLGVDMPSYLADTVANPEYYARCYNIGVGFNVGFITDLRLSRHLNLRFTPGLHFGYTTITYKKKDDLKADIAPAHNLTIPITIPLYLKWSAEREGNYRPYVTVGGGFSLDFNSFADRSNRKILTKPYDGYVGVGFGCDFYCPWFNFTPEIRYEVGFVNAITHIGDPVGGTSWDPADYDAFYTTNIDRLTNQRISIIFNFE